MTDRPKPSDANYDPKAADHLCSLLEARWKGETVHRWQLESAVRRVRESQPESGQRRRLLCPKCGSEDLSMQYHKGDYECALGAYNKRWSEHLHRYCRECDYDWADQIVRAACGEIKP